METPGSNSPGFGLLLNHVSFGYSADGTYRLVWMENVLSFSASGHQLRPLVGVGVAEGPKPVDGISYCGVVAQGNQAH